MNIGEVSSAASSYQGQGSSVKTAPASNVKSESATVDFATAAKEIRSSDSNNRALNADAAVDGAEKSTSSQTTSSLREAVEKINSAKGNAEAVFGIHEGTNRVMIKMVDKDTKEVIKEFPAEETLDLIAKAWELAGIMVDEKR
ncbi:MAG: flagellar protein FlaG [Pseudobutyrivibrio sp.]|nr:flagellar protein FlaG [Pseudobutyrivibrio sp.]